MSGSGNLAGLPHNSDFSGAFIQAQIVEQVIKIKEFKFLDKQC
jgi:hypothetical protein